MASILVEKPDGTQHPFALSFDQSSNDGEHLGQRHPGENQLETVENSLGRNA